MLGNPETEPRKNTVSKPYLATSEAREIRELNEAAEDLRPLWEKSDEPAAYLGVKPVRFSETAGELTKKMDEDPEFKKRQRDLFVRAARNYNGQSHDDLDVSIKEAARRMRRALWYLDHQFERKKKESNSILQDPSINNSEKIEKAIVKGLEQADIEKIILILRGAIQ